MDDDSKKPPTSSSSDTPPPPASSNSDTPPPASSSVPPPPSKSFLRRCRSTPRLPSESFSINVAAEAATPLELAMTPRGTIYFVDPTSSSSNQKLTLKIKLSITAAITSYVLYFGYTVIRD
ncbi:hypothetical protein QL285_094378 [Trifolium repens]|nr:hypothetical protein QL285_094378 [Trifolium repens]